MARTDGAGTAEDAAVATDSDVDFDEKAQAKLLKQEAAARIEGIKARIEKEEGHLDGLKQALAKAIAEEKDL